MSITPAQLVAVNDLGNGVGYIYITDSEGAISTVPSAEGFNPYPEGQPNAPLWKGKLLRDFFAKNSQYAHASYASAYATITLAGANNLTALNVGGVAQIAAPVAMTAGDIPASVASIVAAVNSFNAASPDNYRAVQQGNSFILINTLAGAGPNGDAVTLTFSSGASTGSSTVVGGGRSVGGRPYRIFINASTTATSSSLVGAEEITDILSFHGLEAPAREVQASVTTNTVAFVREAAVTKVYVDGVTTVGNANRVTSFAVQGAVVGDEVIISGIDGSVAPVLTTGAFAYLEREITLTGYRSQVRVRFAEDGTWYQIVPNTMDAAALRNQGAPIPLQPGTFQFTPVGGTQVITLGQTGVSGGGTIYENNVANTGGAVVLASDLEYRVDSTTGVKGETGTVYGNGVAITPAGNDVHFADLNGVQVTLTEELATSGRWAVSWTVVDVGGAASVAFTLTPDFGAANTQFLTTAMIEDLAITNAKIADDTIDGDAKLVDDSVTEVKLDVLVRAKLNVQGRNRVRLSIPTAQVLTLNSVPIQIAAAPGAGSAILVEQVTAKINWNSVIYATNVNLQVKFTGAGEAVAESASFLIRTANGVVNIPLMYTVAAGVSQILENTALFLTVETGDPTAGNSDIFVYVDYSILSV